MDWTSTLKKNPTIVNLIEKELNVSKVIAQLLVNRDINDFNKAKEFFRPSLNDLHDPYLMKDMHESVLRIEKAKEKQEKIMIYGDYDVDGTTSVTLLHSFFSKYFKEIIPYMPDRKSEGYGISLKGIKKAKENNVSLIIAIDCGINALGEVDFARKNGIDFIICDHHLPSKELPNAIGVLNPKRIDCEYPFKELCGCGIGFKLIQAFYLKWKLDFNKIIEYTDLVAIAIISDIVPIIDENRTISHFGIKQLEKNNRIGLKPLLDIIVKPIKASDIAFKIAPVINAAGRLSHAKEAFEMMSSTNIDYAEKKYFFLDDLNKKRRSIEELITKEALDQIELLGDIENSSSVVYKNDWNKGVIGIVASRLIEKYYRPTIVFTAEGENLVGSVRSVKNFDIYKILEKCSTNIIEFGGHKYAAGLTIKKNNFNFFKKSFEDAVKNNIQEFNKLQILLYDTEIFFDEINFKTYRIISQMGPFGISNLKPVFISKKCQEKTKTTLVGKNKEHLKLLIKDKKGKIMPGIAFNKSSYKDKIGGNVLFDILYTIDENSWNGEKFLQLIIKDFKINKPYANKP